MCHVLVIEDQPILAMMIEDTVLDNGATSVDIAATEDDAVAAAARRRPDFITSDVHLLEGTGPHAVATIRRCHGEIPVLFITALPGECSPCAPPGEVLTKPVGSTELGRRFRRAIGCN